VKNIFFVLSMLFTTSIFAQMGMEKDFERCLKKLNLTQEQSIKMEEHRKKHRDSMKGVREKMDKLHEEFQTAIKGDASDKDLKKKFDEIQNFKNEMDQKRFEGMLEIRKILSVEQRLQMHEYMKKKFKRGGNGKKGNRSPTHGMGGLY